MAQVVSAAPPSDPYLWLESAHGARAMSWVKAQDERTLSRLQGDARYAPSDAALLALYDAPDRIPYGDLDHGYVYNFWQDPAHPRGIWRRTPVASYATPAPRWETLIDLDRLDGQEHRTWVWGGADCDREQDRCLVQLSPAGGDSFEVREFDLKSRTFVKGGFSLPTAKSDVAWIDRDTILFGTDFGPGSLTDSSYPRIAKIWRRGERIADARTVFEGRRSDLSVDGTTFSGPHGTVSLIVHTLDFFSAEYYDLLADGSTLRLPIPTDAEVSGVLDGRLIATLREDWKTGTTTIPRGSLIAFPLQKFVQTRALVAPEVLFTPDAHSMIDEVSVGRDAVFASIYRNVIGSIHVLRPDADGKWSDSVEALPQGGSTSIVSTDAYGPGALISFQSFLTPPTLYLSADGSDDLRQIKALPARFDTTGLTVDQYWATSKDGTRIPYFLVHSQATQGAAPTLLYGYGGFQISTTPEYLADVGKIWLDRGGAYAIANIRGGGEFGPAWHEAAMGVNRQRAFDDFAAVAADIEHRGFSTPRQLGIMGGSNGGLLVSTVMTQHPELLGAVVCEVPLIDMLRYTKIGAGASWEAEYGDPADPVMRAAILKYSPYQNVRAEKRYPPVLFLTTTSDNRVTPAHARKMAARMEAQGHDTLFFESTEGGHGAGATHAEAAQVRALSFVFLERNLRSSANDRAPQAAPDSADVVAPARRALLEAQHEVSSPQWSAGGPSDGNTLRRHADLFLRTGQPDSALRLLQTIPAPDVPTRIAIVSVLLAEHDYPTAAPLIEGLARDSPADPGVRSALYAWWSLQGDTARVDRTLRERTAAGTMTFLDKTAAADLQLQELDYAGAYHSFLALQSAATNPAEHARALEETGVALFYLQRYDESLRVLQRALALAPSDAGPVVALGDVLLRLGRVDEAIDALRLALQIAPWNERAHQLLGAGFTRRNYTQLLAALPRNFADASGRSALARGDEALRKRDVASARKIYQQVAAAHPMWADAEVRLGSLEYAEGHFAAARDYFWNAYTLCPEYGRANGGLGVALDALTQQIDIHREQDEAALQAARMPVIPGIDKYVIDWDSLSPLYRKRLALSLQPWARYIPALRLGGATLYVKPIWQLLSQAPYEEQLRDQRIDYDSRLWDDVRGEGGYHVVVSDQDIEGRIDDGYDTVLHEVSHQVNDILATQWDRRIEGAYAQATRRQAGSGNAFLSQYAASSVLEYFAEGANSLNNHRRDPYDTREIVYERLQQRDPALLALTREIMYRADVRPSYSMALVSLGDDLLSRGKLRQADVAYVGALRRDPGNERALVARMNTLVLLGRFKEAAVLATTSVRAHRQNGPIAAEQAEVRWLGGEDAAAVTQWLQTDRSRVTKDEQYLIDLRIGALSYDIGDYAGAQRAFTRVLAYQPDNPGALTGMAAAEFASGRSEQAWKYYDAAVQVRSGDIDVRVSYARDLLLAGDLTRATQQIETALVLDPDDPDALAVHAWALLETGQTADAERTALRAHRLGPWSTLATIVAAAAQRRANHAVEATALLQPLEIRVRDRSPPRYIYRSKSGRYILGYTLPAVDLGLMKTLAAATASASQPPGR
jgi:prolyl oligopeptidase